MNLSKEALIQMQMLRTQINTLEGSKTQIEDQYSILWLIIGGFIVLIPWFFIPGRLSKRRKAIARVDSQIRDIEIQIQMIQFGGTNIANTNG